MLPLRRILFFMLKTLLSIGLGGALGSMSRYLISFFLTRWLVMAFPFATFGINVVGSLLIGLLFGLAERGYLVMHDWRMFLTVGFCGGFTTFSTFSLENLILLRDGDYFGFLIYAIGSLILGLLAVWAGYWLVK